MVGGSPATMVDRWEYQGPLNDPLSRAAALYGRLDHQSELAEIDESVRYYRLLTRRLVDPLRKASVDRAFAGAQTASQGTRRAQAN
jgi:hypothetical protein